MITKDQQNRHNINRWLVANKIGQYVVSVRRNARAGGYKAFLCQRWLGANALLFVPYPYGFDVFLQDGDSGIDLNVISVRNDDLDKAV